MTVAYQEIFKGRSFIVYGLGTSGTATVNSLIEFGALVQAWDDRGLEACKDLKTSPNLKISDQFDLRKIEAIVLSPGIDDDAKTTPDVVRKAKEVGLPIISDVELLYEAVRLSGSKAKFVSITGTNGKSTTTALIAHVLEMSGIPTAVGGNLGPPALGLPILKDDGVYVLELSSYTLERLTSYTSDVAIWLNFTPDHLERHKNLEGYHEAKAHVFDRMKPKSLAILGDWDQTTNLEKKLLAHSIDVKLLTKNNLPLNLFESPFLKGPHNYQNIEACYWTGQYFGLTDIQFKDNMKSFKGLEHRLEILGSYDGITFVNDSKATNAEATIPALKSFKDIYLILGGLEKAGDIQPLREHLSDVQKIYLIGKASELFAQRLNSFGFKNYEECRTLDKALAKAVYDAKIKGSGIVMLSPACASQDQFKSFEDRGKQFKALTSQYLIPKRNIH